MLLKNHTSNQMQEQYPINNIYCDESCHLEHDNIPVMILGAISCNKAYRRRVFKDIEEIKQKYNIGKKSEIKWSRVSMSKIDFYKEIINYFFENDNLFFRGLVIKNKDMLDHEKYNQTHDEWYYKMYFILLSRIIKNDMRNDIYLDIKDTKGSRRRYKLQEVLSNNIYDFNKDIVHNIQAIDSRESLLLQIVDLFIGALGYTNRALETSEAKLELIKYIKEKTGYSLIKSTLPTENKFNIFIFPLNKKEAVDYE